MGGQPLEVMLDIETHSRTFVYISHSQVTTCGYKARQVWAFLKATKASITKIKEMWSNYAVVIAVIDY